MDEKLKAEEEERRKRDQEKLRKETRSLRDIGEMLDKKEQEAMDEMQTADELLPEDTSKLQAPLSSGSKVDSQGAKVACLMIETAKSNQAKAQTQTIRSCWRKLYQRMFCCTIKEEKVKVNVNYHFTSLNRFSASSVKKKFCCVSNHLLD